MKRIKVVKKIKIEEIKIKIKENMGDKLSILN